MQHLVFAAIAALAVLFFTVRLWPSIAVRLGLALLVLVGPLIMALPAYAQAAATADSSIHLSPALQSDIVNVSVAIILAVGAALWKWIDSRSPIKNEQVRDLARSAYMDLLDKGAQFGATQIDSALTRVGSIDVGHAGVAAGANFVIAHGPDLAKAVGVDVTTPEGQALIAQSIAARVGTLLGNAAADSRPIYRIAIPESVQPAAPGALP